MKLPFPLTASIEKVINTVLSMDPDHGDLLAPLVGRVIEVNIAGLGASVYLIVLEASVEVAGFYDGDIDTVLTGSPVALLSLTTSTSALFDGRVKISGDLEVGKQVRHLVKSLDVDIEEQVSGMLGDPVARKLSVASQRFSQWFTGTTSNTSRDMGDYLVDEIDMVVSREELNDFHAEVDELRHLADRLDERLRLLENQTH